MLHDGVFFITDEMTSRKENMQVFAFFVPHINE